jgi:hypothetical protein
MIQSKFAILRHGFTLRAPMRNLSILLSSALLFGAGFAAGDYFVPQAMSQFRTLTGPGSGNRNSSAESNEPAQATATEETGPTSSGRDDISSILHETNAYHRYKDLTSYADSLRPEDLPGAIQKFQAKRGNDKEDTVDILIGKWVKDDPDSALAAARMKENHQIGDEIFQTIYGGWMAHDPQGTMALIQQLPDNKERDDALIAGVFQTAGKDPFLALKLSREITSSNFQTAGNHFIFSRWADQDLDQATQALFQSSNFANQTRRQEAVEGIADHLLEKDPQTAVAWLAQIPPGTVYNLALTRVAGQWAQSDPQAALTWMQNLPASSTKNDAINQAIGQWTDHDPQGAIAYAATLPDGQQKDDLINKGVAVWAQADAPSAWDWAQGLPSSEAKEHDMAAVVSNWAKVDPASAAQHLASLPDPNIGKTPMELLEASMMMNSWRNAFPALSDKEQAYADVATNWATTDPVQGANWLAQLPEGSSRDAAVKSFSDQVADSDPSQAVQLSESIGDASIRQAELTRLLQQWMQKDPAAAANAAQESPLPADVKARFQPTNPEAKN